MVQADAPTFEVALRSQVVPAKVQATPVRFGRAEGGICVEVTRSLAKSLERAGFTRGGKVDSEASCWAEALPLQPAPEPELPMGTLLFTTSAQAGFLSLAGELMRLGCDRQQLCFYEEEGRRRCVARVVEPPYYAVLKALDERSDIQAFVPRGRVAVQLGRSHPMASEQVPPQGRWLLLEDGGWSQAPDGPWSDLYEHADVALPETRPHRPIEPGARLQVALRLVRAPRSAAPSLWVIREEAVPRIERMLHTLPEAVVAQLRFLASGPPDDCTVVLQARRSELGPPALDLEAEAYVPLAHTPHLHVPVGMAIDPPLRPARLRGLVAPSPEQIVWLSGPNLRIEEARERDLRPLQDWVDYFVDQHAPVLEAWTRATSFAFEPYTTADRALGGERKAKARREKAEEAPEPEVQRFEPYEEDHEPAEVVAPLIELPAPRTPGEAELALLEAVEAICALDTPLDDPARAPLWLRVARCLDTLDRRRDATLCWVRALWHQPDPRAIAQAWAESAGPAELAEHPTPQQVAAVTASLVAGRSLGDAEAVQRWFAAHESSLDLRGRWLGRQAVDALVGGDALARLATRDSIFEALRHGMPLARNVPTFVQARARGGGTEGLATALEAAWARFRKTKRQRSPIEAKPALTRAYVELTLAWGHAKLGAWPQAEVHRDSALAALPADPVHDLCRDHYLVRITEAVEGRPPGALPPELQARREALGRLDRYKVDRLLQGSEVLEPSGGLDPFEAFRSESAHVRGDEFAGLAEQPASARAKALDGILGEALKAPSERRRRLHGVLDLIGTLPDPLAGPRLAQIIAASLPADDVVALFADVVLRADELERGDLIRAAFEALAKVADAAPPAELAAQLGRVAPALHRVGVTAGPQALLEQLDESLGTTGAVGAAARLQVAACRAALGQPEAVAPVFEGATAWLDGARPDQRLALLRAMSRALARTDPEQAVAGVEALAAALPATTDSFNTNSHFCLSVLQLVECMVLALASEALALDDWARAFVEEDEHLLRRRIHRDLTRGGAH